MGKKSLTARSAVTRKTANGTMPPANAAKRPKVLQTTRRKASPAAKSGVTPKPVAKRMTGNSSSRATMTLRMQSPTSVKKGGQDGHRRRSDINYRKIIG
jgi:hypothetical protein